MREDDPGDHDLGADGNAAAFRGVFGRVFWYVGRRSSRPPKSKQDASSLDLEAAALHREATSALEALAPHAAQSHVATANYIEMSSDAWSSDKVRETLRVADHVAAVRRRHHVLMSFVVLTVSSALGFLASNLVRLLPGDASKVLVLQLAAFLGFVLLLNELLGKNLFLDQLKERREAWRSAVKTLLKKATR